MGLREEKKRKTREALIEAALRLFDARGYDTTTVAEIAAAAGVSPATFFNYYASKEDVVFADQHVYDRIVPELLATADPREPVGDLVLRAIRALATAQAWTFPLDDPLTAIRLRLIGTTPTLRASFLLRNQRLVDDWIAATQEIYAGKVDGADIALLVGAVFGALSSALQANIGPDGLPRRPESEVVLRATELVVDGIRIPGMNEGRASRPPRRR